LLIEAFNEWLRIPDDKKQSIKEITQMLHNASLIVDDIEDNSKLRRGIPVAHSVYGVPQTINSANYVYFLALEKTLGLGDQKAVDIFTCQLLELHRGQGKELYWRDSTLCPTEDEYLKMIRQKTGGLFRLAVDLMQLFSENKSDFYPLLDCLGVYFQVRDDYCNLQSAEYTENKSFCEDLTEGKYSFPIIHGIRANPSSHQMTSILRQRTSDVDLKKHFLLCLQETKSFEYTRHFLDKTKMQAVEEVSKLGGNPQLLQVLHKLSEVHQ
jgi:geranylgeranyl diphosphate synthase type 3